jgi:hypothetical protein
MIAHLIYARSRLGFPIRYFPEGVPKLWSHVGVYIPEKAQVWEARMGHRFGPTPLIEFMDRYRHMEIVNFEVPDLNSGMCWLEENRGKPYGMLTVIGMALGLANGENSGDHCSEAAENFLHACGLRRWRSDLHRISPNRSHHNIGGVQ